MNVIMAGIPRSGTTLACHLLNQLPNVVALVEPMDMNALMSESTSEGRMRHIERYCASVRHDLHNGGRVRANQVGGNGTNTFGEAGGGEGRKASLIFEGVLDIDKPLQEGFSLVIKHPNAFSALLPELTTAFSCYAIIRNPLSVLASWNSLDHPLSKGRAPMAEAFDKYLCRQLDVAVDDLDRQLVLLGWYYEQYLRVLGRDRVIRYEDMIATDGQALRVIDMSALHLSKPLASRNSNGLYSSAFTEAAYERLLSMPSHDSFSFYTAKDLEGIYQEILSR